MSRGEPRVPAAACAKCLRRGWLLAELGGPLDHVCPDRERMLAALALEDEQLMSALAGRRRREHEAAYAAFAVDRLPRAERIEAVCRHHELFPAQLRFPSAPRALYVANSAERLHALVSAPVVAVLGSQRASDYGMEIARTLARELTVAGVTVTCGLQDGIAVAALTGVSDARGGAVCVLPSGADVPTPGRRRSLYEHLTLRGCAVSELPCGSAPRRWGSAASERVIVGLARLAVLVEAEDSARALAPARLASALGGAVAAVPGRVTSPLSAGTNALLACGTSVLRDAADALELLSPATAPRATRTARALEPRLQAVFDRVCAGEDTPDRLRAGGKPAGEVLYALSELELMGLLGRGDGGRYIARELPRRPGDPGPAP
jgi:DNA processing protein